jgi:hypothetical protein
MTPLYFEDLSTGDQYELPSRIVTDADVMAFTGLSGVGVLPSPPVLSTGRPWHC